MEKNILFLLATVFLNLTGSTQVVTEKMTFGNNHGNNMLELKLAKDYTIKKPASFPTVIDNHSPVWAITYENDKVVLTATSTTRAVDDNGIPGFTDQLISIVKEQKKEVKMLDDGILLQDGKNIGYIKFYSKDTDQKKYNYLFYISAGDQLVLFSFSCPKKLRKSWETVAEEIAASLRVS